MSEVTCIADLTQRLALCLFQCFQAGGMYSTEDPITGRRSRIVPARLQRHSELPDRLSTDICIARDQCYFCQSATPSVLFAIDASGEVFVPLERESIEAASAYLEDKDRSSVQTYYGLAQTLSPANSLSRWHAARTFLNLAPAVDISRGECSTVTAVNPAFHAYDFHDLPEAVVKAIVRSWQVQEALAEAQKLSIVPFLNGGKRRESGATVSCCHSQTYLLQELPPLYAHIRSRREQVYAGRCPVCERLLDSTTLADYAVWHPGSSSFVVLAHPAPLYNWNLLIIPREHCTRLGQLDPSEFASVLQRCVRALRGLFGAEPAFNVVIRCGGAIGHLHAELIPRTWVNIHAGYELAGQEFIITVDPRHIREELWHRMV